MNGTVKYAAFWDWLFSFSINLGRFPRAAERISHPCISSAESIMWDGRPSLLNHVPIDGHCVVSSLGLLGVKLQ